MRISKRIAIGFAILSLGAAPVLASDFPDKTVTINVPFPPGGVADQMARPIAAALEKLWKQPVVVSNKPGGAGGLGMRATADAKPDGYTIMATTTAITALPVSDAIMGRTSLISPAQFTPLARISADPLIMVVKADAPWKTFADFVKDAKENPGQITYASSGTYGPVHLPAEMMAHAADIKLKHVAYTGGGPSITALLGGHVAATFGGPAVLAPMIKSGQLRALVGTGAQRAPLLPDVPTLMESGYPVEYYLWAGLFTSAKVPADIVKELRSGIAAAVKDPEYLQQMKTLGIPVEFLDGENFGKFWKEDSEKIEVAIRRIGKIQ